ncbi:MAG: sugar transferase [Planctomycetes bacterium]|nr:sugar transferase [Planctomycetota bacterium]
MTPRRRQTLWLATVVSDALLAGLCLLWLDAEGSILPLWVAAAVGLPAILGVSDLHRHRSWEVEAVGLLLPGLLLLMPGLDRPEGWGWLLVASLLGLASRSFIRRIAACVATQDVTILGQGPRTTRLLAVLNQHPACGLRPVAEATQSAGSWLIPVTGPFRAVPSATTLRPPADFGAAGRRWQGLPNDRVLWAPEGPGEGASGRVKRGFDLVVTLAVLPLAIPLGLVVALVVWLVDGRPVLYSQTRLTMAAKPFRILKFRTMPLDAEAGRDAVWPQADDQRVTALGRRLRGFWLDELPQLWNVLRGDLSLVGPRPERPIFAQVFTMGLPKYTLRYSTRAGITGWAQVQGYVGNTSLRKRLTCDLAYIEAWRPSRDVCILAMTLGQVFGRRSRPRFDYEPVEGVRIP